MSVERIQRIVEPARLQRVAGASPLVPAEGRELEPATSGRPVVRIDREGLRQKPVVFPEDTSAAAHSYRMLRAQVLRKVRENNLRSIGVISAVDGEGKTLTSVNLALSLAADPNQTVLLVDLDLRRPNVAKLLELQAARGFDSWIAREAAEDEICYAVEGMPRLFVVPTLAPVAGSSDRLADPHARELLAEMKEGRFNQLPNRLMLIDLPPVLLADDFLTIAPLIDGVVLVAKEGYSQRDDLKRVQELLGGVRLLGTVLNQSTQSENRSY